MQTQIMETDLSLFGLNGELGSVPRSFFIPGFRFLLRQRLKLVFRAFLALGTRLALAFGAWFSFALGARLAGPFSIRFFGTRLFAASADFQSLFIGNAAIFFLRAELLHPLLLFRRQNEWLIGRLRFALALRLFLPRRAIRFSGFSATLRLTSLLRARFRFVARTPLFQSRLCGLLLVCLLVLRCFFFLRFVLLTENRSDLFD
jgi:hypothetical protein